MRLVLQASFDVDNLDTGQCEIIEEMRKEILNIVSNYTKTQCLQVGFWTVDDD